MMTEYAKEDAEAGKFHDADDVDWLESVSGIETHQGVLYFCESAYFTRVKRDKNANFQVLGPSCDQHPPATSRRERRVSTTIPSFISRFPRGVCMSSVTAYNPLNMQQSPVENHFSNQNLLEDLQEAFPDAQILKNFSYFPHKPDHFERGFTIVLSLRLQSCTKQEAIVRRLAVKYNQAAYFLCEIKKSGEHHQKLVLLQGDTPTVVNQSLIVIDRLSYHPAYLHPKNNSVFHRFTDAMDMLSKYAKFPEVQELFEIAKHIVKNGSADNLDRTLRTHPVIAIEGISDAGITTQSQKISQAIGAQCLHSPPVCIQHLREKFDRQNNVIRAAFYFIGNYILSAQMEKLACKSPVIVDRYWNSTVAFTIVSEVGTGKSNLPPRNHFIYQWPTDLREPDAVVLIGSRREIRNSRRTKNAVRCTKEQQKRHMIMEIYRRMKTFKWLEVDRCKDKCWPSDATTVVAIGKLEARKLVNFNQSSECGICPGAPVHPSMEHDLLPLQKYDHMISAVISEDIPLRQ